MASLNVRDLGDFIRDQRRTAQISLRQLAKQAGVSNPYLSQIERGLRKPSADILAQIAKALRISAEVLYVQAGFLEEREGDSEVIDSILQDKGLTERQRQVILEIYEAFRRENATGTGSDAEAVAAGSTRAGVPAAEFAGAVAAAVPATGPAAASGTGSARSTAAGRTTAGRTAAGRTAAGGATAGRARAGRSTGGSAAKSGGGTAGSATRASTAAKTGAAKTGAAKTGAARSAGAKRTA